MHESTPDAPAWGFAVTGDGQSTARLADVVRRAMNPGAAALQGLPLKRAAAWVLDGLSNLEAVSWWLRDPVDGPQPLTDDVVWRERCRSGREYLDWQAAEDAADYAACVVFLNPYKGSMDEDEARRRGLPVEHGHGPYFTQTEWERIEELPALRGASGVLEWLRLLWVERIAAVADLDEGRAAHLAVLEADVARLPWLASLALVGPSPARLPEAVAVAASRVAVPAHVDRRNLARTFKPSKLAGAEWTAADRAELRRQYRLLVDRTGDGSPPLSAKVAKPLLAEVWGYEASSIHAFLTKANAEAASAARHAA